MIKWIENLFKPTYLDWIEYEARINMLDDFHFQQKVRNKNIKRL